MRKLVATIAGVTLLAMPSVATGGPGPAWKAACQAVKAAKTTGKPTTPTNTRNLYGKCVSGAAQTKNTTP
jgi:hypothetical protein